MLHRLAVAAGDKLRGAVGALQRQCLRRMALAEHQAGFPLARALLAYRAEQLRHRPVAERPAQQINHRPGLDRLALLRIAHRHHLAARRRLYPQQLQQLPRAQQAELVHHHHARSAQADVALGHSIEEHRKRRPIGFRNTGPGQVVRLPPGESRAIDLAPLALPGIDQRRQHRGLARPGHANRHRQPPALSQPVD